jgi:FKBP-type peptidyl-prolyl cis-trans isomerase
MKTGYQTFLTLSLGTALLSAGCAGSPRATESAPAATKPEPAATAQKPAVAATNAPALATNIQERVGYAIGMSVGNNLKRANFDVNVEALKQGILDVLAGGDLKMTDMQGAEAIRTYQQQRQHELLEKNLKEGEAFLAANKTKEGVRVQAVTLPDGKTAEFQYRVITEGTGEIPRSNDTVTVNFRGKLLNGQEYDSSFKRGRPATFVVERLFRGWSEALQMMKTGSKWELFIPYTLAYGERGSPTVGPGATLILEVDLLSIDTPKPVTSDIIRVPSAEEMKAGAKIEVIKPEEVEKRVAGATNDTKAAKP